MQVFIETTSGLERRLTVGVPAERVENEVRERLTRARRDVRLDGFRPGKVPLKVVEQRFGDGIRREVLGEVMLQSFREAVDQENLKPLGEPSIEPKSLDKGKDLEFVATFEVAPDIELADLSGVEIRQPVAEIGEPDIDEIVGILRRQRGEWENVERPAAEGDRVVLDYAGSRDGETIEEALGDDVEVVLGSGGGLVASVHGFEAAVQGMSAGEEKSIDLDIPEDYPVESLRGPARFQVAVKAVAELVPAPLDEALFEAYGVATGGEEAFRREVRANMQRELEAAVRARVKQQLLEALLAAHAEHDLPKALVAREIAAMRNEMLERIAPGAGGESGLDLDSILPEEHFREGAERRARLGLVFNAAITRWKLMADPAAVRAAVEEMAATYEEPEAVVAWHYEDPRRLARIESMVLEDKVVNTLLESVAVRDEPCSYREALDQARDQVRDQAREGSA